ncbi:SUN domain-containing protein 2-like [Anoplophora glabripennis]|uniref:SUN domain-containing protein 2-like n=1 Tax=Anoplophora glabripennis TaxID=217634 RepID=UPI000C7686AB|nr:SUN domain-containing protein 2-like [Anoplophora glabripennis]
MISTRKLTGGSQFKKLYVDLSDCKVNTNEQGQEVNIGLVPQSSEFRRRRESTSSEDSRVFDFEHHAYSKSLQLKYKVMDNINPCDPGGRNRSNWLKYFVLISITSIMYIYIQTLHSSDSIKRLGRDLDKVKLNIEDSKTKLNRIEKVLNNIKQQQDKQHNGLKSAISQEIEKFSSDKTGKTDFALEATGGKIIQLSPGTENFEQAVTFFGMMLCDGKHGPRAMIQADMSPGNCWAIKGTSGGAIIKLIGRVKIDSVSLEHISKNLSPTGEVSSAPNNFSVWGLVNLSDRGQILGTFSYNINGALVQTFPISNHNSFEYVEFRVLTNQGHPDFTCIYRFRVHGQLTKEDR